MHLRKLLLLAVALPSISLAQAPSAAAPDRITWVVDRAHSELSFSIRHIVTRVRGTFREWNASLTLADPARWETGAVAVDIRTASIFTNDERRDNHLRTSDFFLADSFPSITFRSTKVERDGDEARIYGDLTMRGVTRPVVLEGELVGSNDGRIGFTASTTIDRLDYGVAWNRALEGGGMTLGDEVRIEVNVAFRRPTQR